MTDNVVYFHGVTKLDIPPNRILEGALDKLESVVVFGYNKDGGEFFASSQADAQFTIYMCERAKHKLMAIMDEMEKGA